jgi:serine/threonine protein kinase
LCSSPVPIENPLWAQQPPGLSPQGVQGAEISNIQRQLDTLTVENTALQAARVAFKAEAKAAKQKRREILGKAGVSNNRSIHANMGMLRLKRSMFFGAEPPATAKTPGPQTTLVGTRKASAKVAPKRFSTLDPDELVQSHRVKNRRQVGGASPIRTCMPSSHGSPPGVENREPAPGLGLPLHPTLREDAIMTSSAACTPTAINGSNYKLIKSIGVGASGNTVHLAHLNGGNFCAIKAIRKVIPAAQVQTEIECMQQLSSLSLSPFLIELMGFYEDAESTYLVMEYASGGELFSLVYRNKVHLSDQVAKFYAVETLSALEAIHTFGFMYRDLRPENVLLDRGGHIKLVDFGNAKRAGRGGVCHTLLGDAEYLAPEMLAAPEVLAFNAVLAGGVCRTLRPRGSGQGYTNAVDFWALACFMFEMLAGRTPFGHAAHRRRGGAMATYADMSSVLKESINWSGISRSAQELLQPMLCTDIKNRLCSAHDIKAHAHFDGVRWDKVLARETAVPWAPVLQHNGDTSHYYSYPSAALVSSTSEMLPSLRQPKGSPNRV